jgi:NADH-quinone oxidoreductase subunit E
MYSAKQIVELSKNAESIIQKYPHKRSAVLPLLHLVQSVDGYVSNNGIEFIANVLDLQISEIASVSSFYSMFRKSPGGKYVIGVCKTALCAVMGADKLLANLSKYLDIKNGETTPDGMFTLEEIECNAACDYAPVVMINWEFMDNQNTQSVIETIDKLKNNIEVKSNRSGIKDAKIKQFKEIALELAGVK